MDIYFQQTAQPMVIYFTGGFNFNSYVVGGGGLVADGNYGDITVNGAGSNWIINTGVVESGNLAARNVTFDKLPEIGSYKFLGRHSDTAGDIQEIGIDGGLEFHGGNLRRSALTGDVTANAGNGTTTIANEAVTTAKMGGDVTPAGKTILTAADASAQRSALSLGTAATTSADAYVPKQRYRSFWIGAGAMTPATTSGAAPTTIETTTNDVTYDAFKFDGAVAESVWFNLRMPDEWDRGTVKAVFYWEPDVGASGAVTWGIAGVAIGNDDALDVTTGTEVLVSDATIVVGDLHIATATAAITIAGSPALGDMIAMRIRRVPSDGGDTMTQDACLIGISLQWREGTMEPAAW